MSNPFDYVAAITYGKNDMMTGTENDELAEAGYNSYLTNKSLSYFPDTLLYANEMNMLNHIDNKLQFHYLINSIRPKKRFSKWVKKQEDSDIEAVKEHYKYSTSKAEAALSLLSPQQINEIKKRLNKGG
jgi:hypothetical protein